MPNDNTHTLLPCPFCGADPITWTETISGASTTYAICESDKCREDHTVDSWNTRTPAEPKAGDWEKELEENAGGILERDYIKWWVRRALSSAAPRITERGMNEDWWSEAVDTYFAEHADGKREMPPGAYLRRHWEEDTGYWCNELVHIRQGEDWTTGDIDTMWIGPFPEWVFNAPAPLSGITEEMVEGILDGIRVRGNTDRHHGIRTGIEKAKVAMIALLRQRGANPLAEMVNSTIHAVPVDAAAILRQQGSDAPNPTT